jgi:hypothetical protein
MDDIRKNEELPNMSEMTSIVYSLAKSQLLMTNSMTDMALGLKSVIEILKMILPNPDVKKDEDIKIEERPNYLG